MAIVFTGGSVFIGDGRVLDRATVIIEGDRIQKISQKDMVFPRDAEVIDIKGKMLLPGLWTATCTS